MQDNRPPLAYTDDLIKRAPDVIGVAQAWKVDLDHLEIPDTTEQDLADNSGLRVWIVEAPWAHLAWHSYFISLVHLRDNPNQTRPPMRKFPEATHEVMVWVLDPRVPREPIVEGKARAAFLTPQNFIAQFVATDEEALRRVDAVVTDICAGTFSPDTDFRPLWIKRFGGHFYGY